MNVSVILDVFLAISGALALVGLGGMVTTLTRNARRKDITIAVKMAGQGQQVLTIPAGSPVLQQLAPLLKGINLFPTGKAVENDSKKSAPTKRRSFELVGLVVGAGAAAVGILPFVTEGAVSVLMATSVGALVLTRFGEVLLSVMAQFRSQRWHRINAEQKIRIIAALFLGEEAKVRGGDGPPPER